MDFVYDIQKYNTLLQEDRVYNLLDGLDGRLDKIKSYILQLKPFPYVEQAYAHVRREDMRHALMLSNKVSIPNVAAMISRGIRTGSQHKFTLQVAKSGNPSPHRGKFNPAKTKGLCREEIRDALTVGT